ncbi:hypothetical protein ETB97_012663 [Aspergillus alliaceus]|uniref:Uncharacterized protein n=1 Tax=Petromyces alliaceus TaxID=209559 RepID=A0A8H6A4Y3_PETAA|nr:hypothetical protein ETB97_012663 [Aspergillus burnettii]
MSHIAWQIWQTLNSLPVLIQPCGILVLIAAIQELNGVMQMTLLVILLSLSDWLFGGVFCLEERTPNSFNSHIASRAGTWEQSPLYAPITGDFGRERRHLNMDFRPTMLVADDEYLSYAIEWKVTLNNRVLAKDTKQDLVLTPSLYWQGIKQKAERIVRQKEARNWRVRPDNTAVVVSINDRSQRDLTKRF